MKIKREIMKDAITGEILLIKEYDEAGNLIYYKNSNGLIKKNLSWVATESGIPNNTTTTCTTSYPEGITAININGDNENGRED